MTMSNIVRVLVCVFVFLAILPAAELTVQSVSIAPGQSKELEVRLDGGGSQTTVLQFDLRFDPENLKVVAAAATSITGKKVVSSELGLGWIRYVVVGPNRNVIPDGVLAHLSVSVSETCKVGEVIVTVDNASGADRDAKPLPVMARSGAVRVVAGQLP